VNGENTRHALRVTRHALRITHHAFKEKEMLKNKKLLLVCFLIFMFFFKEQTFSKEKNIKKEQKIKNKIAFVQQNNLWIANPDGTEQKQLTQTCDVFEPSWSPDGKSILFVSGRKIWKYDFATGKSVKFIDMPGYCISPSYSLDGKKIIFTHESNVWDYFLGQNRTEICVASADGTGAHVLVKAGETMMNYPKFFPGGEDILFNELRSEKISSYLATYNFSSRKIEYLNSESGWLSSDFSPDENFLVAGWYSYEKGGELRMISLKTLGVMKLIAKTKGCQFTSPSFSPYGDKIVFEKDYFSSNKQTFLSYGIYVMNSDGSGITEIIPDASEPDWLQLVTGD
jgi:Tol biopolymer transport system component